MAVKTKTKSKTISKSQSRASAAPARRSYGRVALRDILVMLLSDPAQALTILQRQASFKQAFAWLLIPVVLAVCQVAIRTGIQTLGNGMATGPNAGTGLMDLVALGVLFTLLGWFWAIASNGVFYLLARLLGGRGGFRQQFYALAGVEVLVSIFSFAFTLIAAPFGANAGLAAGVTPGIMVAILAACVLLLLRAYFLTFSLERVHGLTPSRALAVWVIPVVVAVFLAFVLIMMVGVLVFGAATQMMGATGVSRIPF